MAARATIAVDGTSTQAGPSSDAVISASGSDVPRQAQECEPFVAARFDGTWCIGHICPSPCSQVHSALTAADAVGGQRAVGMDTSRQRWNTSHPQATRASRGRIQRIGGRLPQLSRQVRFVSASARGRRHAVHPGVDNHLAVVVVAVERDAGGHRHAGLRSEIGPERIELVLSFSDAMAFRAYAIEALRKSTTCALPTGRCPGRCRWRRARRAIALRARWPRSCRSWSPRA